MRFTASLDVFDDTRVAPAHRAVLDVSAGVRSCTAIGDGSPAVTALIIRVAPLEAEAVHTHRQPWTLRALLSLRRPFLHDALQHVLQLGNGDRQSLIQDVADVARGKRHALQEARLALEEATVTVRT